TSNYFRSTAETGEAYGVRAACCRFQMVLGLPRRMDGRKRQQAARGPYASRDSETLNTSPALGARGRFRIWSFGFLSSFVIRHSSFITALVLTAASSVAQTGPVLSAPSAPNARET